MRTTKTFVIAALAFATGAFGARMLSHAESQTPAPPPLTAQIIDTNLLDGEAIGPIQPNTDLRSKILVVTDKATVQVQQGDVPKHTHMGSDEIQYIVAGTARYGWAIRSVRSSPAT